MASKTQTTVSQLRNLIGTPDCPTLIDVCVDEDFNADPRMIPGAFRHPFSEIESVIPSLGKESVVIICQKGLKISQGAAAILRASGIRATSLEGGNFAWRDAGGPLVPNHEIPDRGAQFSSLWVTGQNPDIDSHACAWLIRRFIDKHARFLFVTPSEALIIAEKFEATPFGIKGALWSKRDGRCTFDVMAEALGLATKALKGMRTAINHTISTTAPEGNEILGLGTLMLGQSYMYKEDIARLEAALPLFDALYHWAREATEVSHNPPN